MYFFFNRVQVIRCRGFLNFLSGQTCYVKRWSFLYNHRSTPYVSSAILNRKSFFNTLNGNENDHTRLNFIFWKFFYMRHLLVYYLVDASIYRYNPLTSIPTGSFSPHYTSTLSVYQRWPIWYRFCGSA